MVDSILNFDSDVRNNCTWECISVDALPDNYKYVINIKDSLPCDSINVIEQLALNYVKTATLKIPKRDRTNLVRSLDGHLRLGMKQTTSELTSNNGKYHLKVWNILQKMYEGVVLSVMILK